MIIGLKQSIVTIAHAVTKSWFMPQHLVIVTVNAGLDYIGALFKGLFYLTDM